MIDMIRAITPPNLDGIDRNTTYANKKYHSGWIWTGATKGFAMLKFSTSPRMFGVNEIMVVSMMAIRIRGRVSFTKNNGLNLSLSLFVDTFDGLEDPFSCRRIRWISTITVINIGRRKCREKNRFRVGCETEGPPQIQVTKSPPTKGIAESTPVITVAPQNDICPHGSTYPRNAVAITASRIITPEIHTFFWFMGELKYSPRAVWMYNSTKNREAPFMWIIRVTHPVLMSCMIPTIVENAVFVSALYIIDKMIPETSCSVRVIPSRNPIFHKNEIDEGVGRSISEDFIIFRIGLFFVSCFFI